MSWSCDRCGEKHKDDFSACWRCGWARPLTREEAAAFAEADAILAAEETEESEPRDVEAETLEHVLAYEREQGWYPPLALPDQTLHAAAVFGRFFIAWRLRSTRLDSATARPRPDVDARWRAFFLVAVLFAGLLGMILAPTPFATWMMMNETRFLFLYLPLLFGSVLLGSRAVKAELRAAAEEAVRTGYRARGK